MLNEVHKKAIKQPWYSIKCPFLWFFLNIKHMLSITGLLTLPLAVSKYITLKKKKWVKNEVGRRFLWWLASPTREENGQCQTASVPWPWAASWRQGAWPQASKSQPPRPRNSKFSKKLNQKIRYVCMRSITQLPTRMKVQHISWVNRKLDSQF